MTGTTSDPRLPGVWKWDDNLHRWSGQVAWEGRAGVRLNVSGSGHADDPALARAAAIVRAVDARAVYAHAATKLLDLHNRAWRDWTDEHGVDHEGPVLDAAQFVAKVLPEALNISEDGSVEVHLADGGLFDGHVIIVRLDESLRPIDATIAG